MTSLNSSFETPFDMARFKWARNSFGRYITTRAATVMRLRYRFESPEQQRLVNECSQSWRERFCHVFRANFIGHQSFLSCRRFSQELTFLRRKAYAAKVYELQTLV